MADYNLNYVLSFKKESIMYYIGNTNYICVMLSYLKYRHLERNVRGIQDVRGEGSKITHMNFIWQSCHHLVTICHTIHKSSLWRTG